MMIYPKYYCTFVNWFFRMGKTKKIVSLLLLVLYVGYYAGTTFFVHSHNCTNGVIIHSHPYTSATHTHSTTSFQLIDSLTTTLFVGGAVLIFLVLFSVSKAHLYSFYRQYSLNSLIGSNPLRAPPVVWTMIFLIYRIYVISI